MPFGETFWRVWEVRTSIKIQESIEDYFNRKPQFDNTSEIVQSLVVNRISWNQKIENSRQKTNSYIKTILCEYCNNRFNLFTKVGDTNQFTGLIFFDNTAFRTNEEVVINVTNRFQNDTTFKPLFYCSKKCALEDRSITISDFL